MVTTIEYLWKKNRECSYQLGHPLLFLCAFFNEMVVSIFCFRAGGLG